MYLLAKTSIFSDLMAAILKVGCHAHLLYEFHWGPPLNLFSMPQRLTMPSFMLSSQCERSTPYLDLRTPTI